jgi:hypothetical protein
VVSQFADDRGQLIFAFLVGVNRLPHLSDPRLHPSYLHLLCDDHQAQSKNSDGE